MGMSLMSPADAMSIADPSPMSTMITKSPMYTLSPGRITDGVVMRRPLRYVPLVLLRSTTKKRPSCFTTREWRFETLPLLSTMSFPGTRPTVTSSRSKSIFFGVPPFSVTISVNIGALVS